MRGLRYEEVVGVRWWGGRRAQVVHQQRRHQDAARRGFEDLGMSEIQRLVIARTISGVLIR